MKEAIKAFKQVSESDEYKELQRTIELTEFYEATMLLEAEEIGIEKGRAEGRAEERAKFEKLLAEKDAEIARLLKKNND